MVCIAVPVDKNRPTAKWHSGPSYLLQWPQKEDCTDHASRGSFMYTNEQLIVIWDLYSFSTCVKRNRQDDSQYVHDVPLFISS